MWEKSQGLKSSMEKVERKPRPTRFLHDPAWVYLSPFQKISCPWAWPADVHYFFVLAISGAPKKKQTCRSTNNLMASTLK